MSIDSIGDFLTIIRNGIHCRKRSVLAPFSKEKQGIAEVLKEEGYIKDYQKIELENNKASLKVTLKYMSGESAIHVIKRISTPGRRRYDKMKNLELIIGGLGISILTTNAGVLSDKKARDLKVGGEIICHVW